MYGQWRRSCYGYDGSYQTLRWRTWAAFLDRLDRAAGGEDHRVRGLRAALPLLLEEDEGRVARILNLWSDPSVEPIAKADTKAASGVWPGLK